MITLRVYRNGSSGYPKPRSGHPKPLFGYPELGYPESPFLVYFRVPRVRYTPNRVSVPPTGVYKRAYPLTSQSRIKNKNKQQQYKTLIANHHRARFGKFENSSLWPKSHSFQARKMGHLALYFTWPNAHLSERRIFKNLTLLRKQHYLSHFCPK